MLLCVDVSFTCHTTDVRDVNQPLSDVHEDKEKELLHDVNKEEELSCDVNKEEDMSRDVNKEEELSRDVNKEPPPCLHHSLFTAVT